MNIVEHFSLINCEGGNLLQEQIHEMECCLTEHGYHHIERSSRGTTNVFYYNDDESIVFVTYYSKNKQENNVAFTTLDKKLFDAEFRYTNKKIGFATRSDKSLKAVVSNGTSNVLLCHMTLGIVGRGICADHKYNSVWLNDSFCVRPATAEQNLRNRWNSKKFVGDEFDYNPAMDFRDTWWLLLGVTMLHELTLEEAMALNKEVRQ
ncbi:hypothetical protein [Agathobacter rectalis]|uniref:Uncharacterized protein n=1 Tax=Agathobacter rectalis TaxID=39491 RepID=A0A2U2ECP9_9FIRM|nr:hypothetical protein [Agathobacter rectalis]PWE82281.1 hypothetical protein LD38_16870 [Agathobacter rectalis]